MGRHGSTPPGNYAVGYKKPPMAHRFKKGQSGNPKGKPRGLQPLESIFLVEANRLVTIKSGETVQKVRKAEALVRRLIDMALQGDLGAARLALPHLFAADPQGSDPADVTEAAPLSEAERAAMQILLERVTTPEAKG